MGVVFAIRREVIEKMLENPEFRKRLVECRTSKEITKLVYETAKQMGFEVIVYV